MTVQRMILPVLLLWQIIIILSLPIKQTIAFIKELANLDLKEGVIISDAGSTKSAIVDAAEQYLDGKSVRLCRSPIPWLVVTRQELLLRMQSL